MMQGCNDFTPPFWEEVVLVLRLPHLPPLMTQAILGLFTPRRRAIVCRACKVELELALDLHPPRMACPSCKKRVAFCLNKRTMPPEAKLNEAMCFKLAGHDGPCFERTRP